MNCCSGKVELEVHEPSGKGQPCLRVLGLRWAEQAARRFEDVPQARRSADQEPHWRAVFMESTRAARAGDGALCGRGVEGDERWHASTLVDSGAALGDVVLQEGHVAELSPGSVRRPW